MVVPETLFLLIRILFPEKPSTGPGPSATQAADFPVGGLLPSGPLQSCGPPEDCLPVPWERRRQKNSLLPLYPLSHHNTDTRAAKTQANFSTNGLVQVQKQRHYSIGGAKAKTEVNLNFLPEPIPREKTTSPSPWANGQTLCLPLPMGRELTLRMLTETCSQTRPSRTTCSRVAMSVYCHLSACRDSEDRKGYL